VLQHPKENDVSSTVQSHPKENDASSMVTPHQKDDDVLSTVTPHRKENKSKIFSRKQREKIMFRERNGAAYQVPNNWEELYEESENKQNFPVRTRAKNNWRSNSIKPLPSAEGVEVSKKADYYTSMQREISSEIKKSHLSCDPNKTIKKNKSRWNKKHLAEIEADKSMLHTWVENGIVCKAFAPRYQRSLDSDDIGINDCEGQVKIRKEITLGDFMPSKKIESSVKPDDYQSSTFKDHEKSPENVELSTADNKETIQAVSRQRCRLYHGIKDTSYPGCCGFSGDESQHDVIKVEPPKNGFATNEFSDDEIDFALNSSAQVSDDEKSEKRDRIPMCVHGVHYHLERISKSLFTEAESILETLPLRQLNEFAEAFRKLIASVEDLRFCHLRQTLLECSSKYCRWNNFKTPDDKSVTNLVTGYTSSLISFEVKLAEVSSPRYRLKILLKDSYDRRDVECTMSRRYRKALDTFEISKIANFADNIDQFVNVVYREVFILLESLPSEEANSLRRSINEFNGATWRMRDQEEKLKKDKLRCCGLFRSRNRFENEESSDGESIASTIGKVGESTGKLTQVKLLKIFDVKDRLIPVSSEQCSHTVMTEQDASPEQCSHTTKVEHNKPTEQCSHTAEVECPKSPIQPVPAVTVSDSTDYQSDGNSDESNLKSQEFDPVVWRQVQANIAEAIYNIVAPGENLSSEISNEEEINNVSD